jgi:ketosteroid isomerase-like protein
MLAGCALMAGSEIVGAAQKEAPIDKPAPDQYCAAPKVPEDLKYAIDAYHAARQAFVKGDPKPQQQAYSHCEDVTIFGPFGGYYHGWKEQVEKRFELMAAKFQGGTLTSENLSLIVSPDLACSVDLEYQRVQLEGVRDTVEADLRVTTVFRREGEQWKIVHQHADLLGKSARHGFDSTQIDAHPTA